MSVRRESWGCRAPSSRPSAMQDAPSLLGDAGRLAAGRRAAGPGEDGKSSPSRPTAACSGSTRAEAEAGRRSRNRWPAVETPPPPPAASTVRVRLGGWSDGHQQRQAGAIRSACSIRKTPSPLIYWLKLPENRNSPAPAAVGQGLLVAEQGRAGVPARSAKRRAAGRAVPAAAGAPERRSTGSRPRPSAKQEAVVGRRRNSKDLPHGRSGSAEAAPGGRWPRRRSPSRSSRPLAVLGETVYLGDDGRRIERLMTVPKLARGNEHAARRPIALGAGPRRRRRPGFDRRQPIAVPGRQGKHSGR